MLGLIGGRRAGVHADPARQRLGHGRAAPQAVGDQHRSQIPSSGSPCAAGATEGGALGDGISLYVYIYIYTEMRISLYIFIYIYT